MTTRSKISMNRRSRLLATTLLCTLAAGTAHAQDTSTPKPAPAAQQAGPTDAGSGFGDIVVTARKREESLQDVPLTITAFSNEAILKTDTKTIYDLATRTPGLYYGTSGGRAGGNKLQIRNFSTGTSGGSKASVFIDGVYVSGDYSSTALENLDRIEVLKGPQSAYFGRSTFVGAVNFVTKDPGDKFEGRIEGSYAAYNETDFNGFITTPIISEKLSNTFSGRVYDFRGPGAWTGTDGYHFGDQSTKAITDKLVFHPVDGLTLRWYNSYTYDRDHIPQTSYAPLNTRNAMITRPDGTVSYYFQGPVNIDHSNADASTLYQTRVQGVIADPGLTRKQFRSVISMDAEIAGQTLSGFAAYGNEDVHNNYDAYFLGPRTVTAPNANGVATNYTFVQNTYYAYYKTKDHQYEIRLSSPGDWRIRYLIGYNHTVLSGANTFIYDPVNVLGVHTLAAPTLIASSNNNILGNPAKTDAVFGGLYFDVTPKITVSAELRHQWDDIHPITYSTSPLTPGLVTANFENTFQATLPRFNIQYKPNKNINLYAVYSVGDNPGIFNTGNVPVQYLPANVSVAVPEEKLYDYEAGIKTTWLDGRLTFDLAVYHMDWKNEQVQQSYVTNYPSTGAVTALYSGGAASYVTGFEAELDAQATRELSLRATASYGKAKYKTYCSSNYYALTGIATSLGCRSVAGFQQEGTPALQISLFADYTRQLSADVSGYIRADYQYQSKVYLEEWDMSWIAPANLMGLRVGVEKGNLGIEVFARNLLNDDHSPRITRATYAPGVGGAACSVAVTNAGTCPAGSYPAPVTAYGQVPAGAAGNQDIADTARRPRQIGVKLTAKF